MTPATITELAFGDKSLTNIAITEVGEYSVPARLIAGPVRPSALEVVRISVGAQAGSLVLEARDNIVTTELLTDDVRLEIAPKVSFDAFHLLLQWSIHPTKAPSSENLPVAFKPGIGVYDLFVRLLLEALEGVVRGGWLPLVVERSILAESVYGAVDMLRSLDHIMTTRQVAFYQTVNAMSFESPANRVLRTALSYVASAARRIDARLLSTGRDMLASMPTVATYPSAKEALGVCEDILDRHTLDGSRTYYYPALQASLPILQAASRSRGGNPEYEDVPLRISMPDTFESAIRRVSAAGLGRTFHVYKATDAASQKKLYRSAIPVGFNPGLEPDIVVQRIGVIDAFATILDVKYKDQPSPSDHHQLAAYMQAYDVRVGGFVTATDDHRKGGPRQTATTAAGAMVTEYAIYTGALGRSLDDYAAWLRSTVLAS